LAVSYNSSIVTNGLVLCLDAGNPRSYPGTGTTWYDISGYGNHHTLINSPTWASGKFTLNGTTQGFQRLAALNGATAACTVSLWYSTTDTTELWVMGNNNTSYYLSASDSNNYYNSNCGSPTNYVDLSQTLNPTTPVNYKNGVYHMWEAKSVDFVTAPWTRFDWYSYPAPWYMAGSASVIMVYNRILTAAESAQNFAAYRGRYGV